MAKKKKSKNMKPGTNPHVRKQQNQAQKIESPAQQTSAVSEAPPVTSLAQKRAKHALAAIEGIDSNYGKYASYVSALPATIIMSGLGQAMAMLKSGKKPGHGILYKHMQDWLCTGWSNGCYSGELLPAIIGGTEDDYIRAQAEAMQYLEWLKKFAVAFLDSGDDTGSGGDDANTTD